MGEECQGVRSTCVTATVNGAATAQHRQPPATSRTVTPESPPPVASKPPAVSNTAPSIPSAPNSLTTTAHLSVGGRCEMRWRIAVVLPTPSTPVMMLTGIGIVVSRVRLRARVRRRLGVWRRGGT